MLRAVLVGYGGLLVGSLVAAPCLCVILLRSRRTRRSRPLVAKGFLIAISCLFSLMLLELASTAWQSWMHRFPKLRLNFPTEDPDLFRIVVLGGSSALGEPYRPWISPGQILAWRLAEALPERRFECEILAWLGDSLEMQHRKLAALARRPGMVIIYSGHNEFAARYEEERDGWLDAEPGAAPLRPIYRASLLSPFCRLAYEIISKNRLDEPPPLSGRHQLIDPPQCSAAEAEAIRIDFEGRLEALTAYCEAIGAVPVLIIPPANEADYEPSRSTLPRSASGEDRAALARDFGAARALETRDPAGSAELLQNILDRYPGFAEAHYRLAGLLERAGRQSDAEHHYQAALDHDGLPIRCQAALRAAIDRVAARHKSSILIDGRRELVAASPRKLLDDHVIQDTHHPTLMGQVALADALLRELARKKVFGIGPWAPEPLDPATCAAYFEMDAPRWATMCERTSEHYRRVAGYRYDPAERLEKSRKYAEAAKKIRNGMAPDQVGVPGVGVRTTGGPGQRGAEVDPWNAGEERARRLRPGTSPGPSAGNALDLPVLEQHGRPSAEELHDGHELISVGALDHLADDAGERAAGHTDRGPHGDRRLFGDDQSRADHGVNLTKVALEHRLIGDFKDRDDPVAAKCDQPIFGLTLDEHVTREERDDRFDAPSLRCAALPFGLGKKVGDARIAQLAGDGFLLSRLGVQAPPGGLAIAGNGRIIGPQVGRVKVGLGRKNGHRVEGGRDSLRWWPPLRLQTEGPSFDETLR
jgi:hypothetical protein